jgi:hypothetical protein
MKERIKIRKIGKKGIAVNFLVVLIILLIGFAIILIFYYQLDWSGRVDKEVCHQSVIYRATLPGFAGVREYVPLKCKTEKVCITSGLIGGKCSEFENSKGVVKVKVNNIEQVEQYLARSILECWKMMGEGKVQIFGNWLAENYGIGGVGSSCVICNRIAFDEKRLGDAGIDLEEMDVMEYMQTHAIPNGDISYYAYLAGQGGKISVKEKIEIAELEEIKGELKETENIESFDVKDFSNENLDDSSELSIMFMQITAPSHLGVIENTLELGGISLASGFVTSPVLTAKALGKAIAGWKITLPILAILGVYQHGMVAANRAVTAGYCGDVSLGSDARDGCSVVRTINYNEQDLADYCSIIESIS